MLNRVVVAALVALATGATPAVAAVTLRGIVPEDGPRAAWLDRYSEARQGPEQIEKVSQTYKVGESGALDLSHLAGDIRVTGGGGSEIKIDATKRARHRDPERGARPIPRVRLPVGGSMTFGILHNARRRGALERREEAPRFDR